MNCCYKWLFGEKKETANDLKKDLLNNEVVSEKIERTGEDSNSIGTQTDSEQDDAISEVSTEIDYESDIFEEVEGNEEDELQESQMRNSEVVESELSNNSNATTIVRFIN